MQQGLQHLQQQETQQVHPFLNHLRVRKQAAMTSMADMAIEMYAQVLSSLFI